MEQLESLLHCFLGIARVALQPKVWMMDTDGLFPVHSSNRDTSVGSVECGMTFLMTAVWQRAYGQVVHPMKLLVLSNITMDIVTKVLLTHSATPFSWGVSRLVFS